MLLDLKLYELSPQVADKLLLEHAQ